MDEPRRILVVEDEALLRFSLVAYLEDSGHACREAADGEEALALLATESKARGAQACLFKPLTDMGLLDTTIASLFRNRS